jgi:hypothetical protein
MKLTDEQIEAAAKAAWLGRFLTPHGVADFDTVSPDMQSGWRRAMRAAAPFLQMPWEMPTQSECELIGRAQDVAEVTVHYAVSSFINMRNASLFPKLVDPRRDKLKAAVNEWRQCEGAYTTSEIVDRILAALDAKE